MTVPSNAVYVNGYSQLSSDELNSFIQNCNTVSQARNFVGISNMEMTLLGFSSANDGGQGNFYWNSTSTATDDGGVTVIAPSGTPVGRWIRLNIQSGNVGSSTVIATGANTARTLSNYFADNINVKDFGATGNGVIDDTSSILAASTFGPTIIPSGTYEIGSNLTLPNFVTMMPGATLQIASGKTVTFNAGFDAGIYRVFSGSGTVVFNPEFLSTGYPEWWGAVTNNGSDCLSSINASIVACRVTQLQCADYSVSSTVLMQTPNRTLQGMGNDYISVTGSATRIIVLSGSLNTLQIGPNTAPGGGLSAYLPEQAISNLQLTRSVVPVNGSACSGLIVQFSLYTNIDRVKSVEHVYGFHYTGTVQCHTRQSQSFRSTAGTGIGTDQWFGFYIDGISNVITGVSGNASLYIDECNASPAGSAPFSQCYGYYMDGGFSDVFISRCEADGNTYNIAVIGNGLSTQNYGDNDLHLVECILDGFLTAGVYLNATSEYGSIDINGGYAAPSATGTPTAGILYNGSNAQVVVKNFQIVCGPNAACTGITAISSRNIESQTQIIDCGTVCVALSNVTNSRFLDRITNYAATATQALQCSNTNSRIYAQIGATGKSSGLSIGYQLLSTTTTLSEFNCSCLDASAVSGGSANKLVYNATQITSAGTFGTNNLASGIMA